jgi:hypothetical protein
MQYEPSAGGIMMPVNALLLGGVFQGQIVRDGKVIDEFETGNIVVNEGLNHALDVLLHGATQVGTWYIGLFEANYTPVATVTAATITAAATETTAYDETTRVAYNEAAASSQSTTNSANKATFTFNAAKTIYGAFLVSNSTKSGTTGTLLSAAKFPSAKTVDIADQLLLTYTFAASSV